MYLKFENTNLPMAERAYTPNFSIKHDYNVFTRNTIQMCPELLVSRIHGNLTSIKGAVTFVNLTLSINLLTQAL